VALSVGDELDGYFVRTGISGQRTCGELGKFLVIALREIRSNLSDMLLYYVEIVE
jgi:hypothetical protein